MVVSLNPTKHLFYYNLANPLRILPMLICTKTQLPLNINALTSFRFPVVSLSTMFDRMIAMPLLGPTNFPVSKAKILTPNAVGIPVDR